jgi:competence protein ComEA
LAILGEMRKKTQAGKVFNGWTLAVILLVIVIIAGCTIIWYKSSHNPGIEITLAPEREEVGSIYVGGEVNVPGWYPLFTGDGIDDIVRAAGSLKDGADLSKVELTFSGVAEGEIPQKIDINRAEAWLLEALPGVGEVKAQAIIEYREKNGHFQDINELGKVPGFGEINLDKIKDLITVND